MPTRIYELTISGYLCSSITVRPDGSVLFYGSRGRRTPDTRIIRRATAARYLARWRDCQRGEVQVDPLAPVRVIRTVVEEE